MPEIFVDLPALTQVHRSISRIRHDLQNFDHSYVQSHASAMGHDAVIHAFDDFVYGWKDGREAIDAQLEVAGRKIEGAVEAYTKAEDGISDTANQMRGSQ